MTGLRLLSCAFFLATSSAVGAVLSEGEVIFDGDSVIVGQEADGALTVTPPDVLVLDSLTIAEDAGVIGTVLIDGAGITIQDDLRMGSRGTGILTVLNGGQLVLERSGNSFIGTDGTGRLEIRGAGSEVDLAGESGTNFLFVGGVRRDGFGRGDIFVSQGAELLTALTTLGDGGTTEVIVEGNGSLWRAQNDTVFANAELTLRDGGRLIQTSSNPEHSLKFGASDGTTSVLISGSSSRLSSTGGILIGESGQAVVRVEGGADVMSSRTSLGQRWFRNDGLPRGILELDGFGTTWTTGDLILGEGAGHAEIRITDGATLASGDNEVLLGNGDNSSAVVTIDGPNSRWNTSGFRGSGDLSVGASGRGELRITGGAYHENGYVSIGRFSPGANGKILVSGTGSHWNVHDNLDLIQGEVIVSGGASMQMPRNFFLGEEGSLQLDGGNLLGNPENSSIDNRGQISGDGQIHSQIFNESTGTVYVGPGQRLEVESIDNAGLIQVEGGELRVAEQLFNRGHMDLYDATLRTKWLSRTFRSGGLSLGSTGDSSREMRFLGGDNQVHGEQINLNGRTIVRGNSTVTFFGDVRNNDFFSVADGSTVYFLDQYISFDDVYGEGHIVFEGEVQLGTDTAFGTDVTFAPTASWAVGLFGGNGSLVSDGTVDLGGELSLGSILLPVGSGIHELTIIEAAQVEDTFDFLPEIDSLIGHRTFYRGIEYTDTTVTLLVELLAEGDFNGDGLVDAADYDAWANDFGSTTGNSLADGNGDGLVNAADYTLWRDAMDGELPASVPEPTGLAMCLLLGLALQGRRFRL